MELFINQERMLEQLFSSPPPHHVPLQACIEDEVVALLRDSRRIVGVLVSRADQFHHPFRFGGDVAPWRPLTQHLERNAADAPDVGWVAVSLTCHQLRRQEEGRPLPTLTLLMVETVIDITLHPACGPKVGYLDFGV